MRSATGLFLGFPNSPVSRIFRILVAASVAGAQAIRTSTTAVRDEATRDHPAASDHIIATSEVDGVKSRWAAPKDVLRSFGRASRTHHDPPQLDNESVNSLAALPAPRVYKSYIDPRRPPPRSAFAHTTTHWKIRFASIRIRIGAWRRVRTGINGNRCDEFLIFAFSSFF